MDNPKRREPEFTRDVDGIVAGHPGTPAAHMGGDTNLAFAAKIREARESPSPAFQSDLKRRLLSRLAEVEGEAAEAQHRSFRGRVADLFRQKAWQVAGAALAIVVAASFVAWRTGLLSRQATTVTSPYPTVAVDVRATLSQGYQLGESVQIEFSFKNVSSETTVFLFPPAIRIETTDAQTVRSFPAGAVSKSLEPGDSADYELAWDQKDGAGGQVPPGEYLIVMPNVKLGDAGFLSLTQAPVVTIFRP